MAQAWPDQRDADRAVEPSRPPSDGPIGALSGPPPAPIPSVLPSVRGSRLSGEALKAKTLTLPPTPGGETILLPMSAGLSLVSIPVRPPSDKLADIFPNLPNGSRVFLWDAAKQEFVEGMDGNLPPGHACWLYLPVPTMLMVTGTPNTLTNVSVELENGWNLIGVPYDMELSRADQQVYVNHMRTSFDEAVAAEAIGPVVYSFDVNGYEQVAVDGAFKPTHGYWIYSAGADLIELGPMLMRGGSGLTWGSLVKGAAGGFAEGAGQVAMAAFLSKMGYGPDEKPSAELMSQLDAIQQTQAQMVELLSDTLTRLDLMEAKILQGVGEASLVDPVVAALTTNYDQANPNMSLQWFVNQVASGNKVPMAIKTEFATEILDPQGLNYINKFNMIHTAIDPEGKPGVIDLFGDQVAATMTAPYYDANERYQAMEAYFNRLLGIQIKCATLILNAYTQLGTDDSTKANYPAPETASKWGRDTFAPYIEMEFERFRAAVEGVAFAKLTYPVYSDIAVELPSALQPFLARADYFVMQNTPYPAKEPEGLRVRLLVNPGMAVDALEWRQASFLSRKQQTPIDHWDSYVGDTTYDDWSGTRPDLALENVTMNLTKRWKVARIILVRLDDGTYKVQPRTNPTSTAEQTVSLSHGFASVTVVGRLASTVTLNPRFAQPEFSNACSPVSTGPTTYPSDTQSWGGAVEGAGVWIRECKGTASVGYNQSFTYSGAYQKSIILAPKFEITGCEIRIPPRLSCKDFASVVELYDDTTAIPIATQNWETIQQGSWGLGPWVYRYTPSFNVDLKPGHTYKMHVFLKGESWPKDAFSAQMKWVGGDVMPR